MLQLARAKQKCRTPARPGQERPQATRPLPRPKFYGACAFFLKSLIWHKTVAAVRHRVERVSRTTPKAAQHPGNSNGTGEEGDGTGGYRPAEHDRNPAFTRRQEYRRQP